MLVAMITTLSGRVVRSAIHFSLSRVFPLFILARRIMRLVQWLRKDWGVVAELGRSNSIPQGLCVGRRKALIYSDMGILGRARQLMDGWLKAYDYCFRDCELVCRCSACLQPTSRIVH